MEITFPPTKMFPRGQKSAFTQPSLTSWPRKSRGWDLRLAKKPRLIQAHLALLLWICSKSQVIRWFALYVYRTGKLNVLPPLTQQLSGNEQRYAQFRLLFVPPPRLLCKTWQRASRLKKKEKKKYLTHVCIFTFY